MARPRPRGDSFVHVCAREAASYTSPSCRRFARGSRVPCARWRSPVPHVRARGTADTGRAVPSVYRSQDVVREVLEEISRARDTSAKPTFSLLEPLTPLPQKVASVRETLKNIRSARSHRSHPNDTLLEELREDARLKKVRPLSREPKHTSKFRPMACPGIASEFNAFSATREPLISDWDRPILTARECFWPVFGATGRCSHSKLRGKEVWRSASPVHTLRKRCTTNGNESRPGTSGAI